MNQTALQRFRDRWHDQGLIWQDRADGTACAQAPGHSPADRSVTFRQIDGRVLMNSHADTKEAVLDAVGLTPRDFFDDANGTTYTYRDGRTVHRSFRDDGRKDFRQSGNTKGRDLYRVERLDDVPTGTPVYVVEGEQDVHAVESAGGVAVCNAMGAGKAKMFDWSPLTGHTVVIVADDDEPGSKHALQVHDILTPIAAGVVIAQAAAGKDAADHITAGYGLDELVIVDMPGTGGRRLRVTRGTEVKMQRIRWVMEDWIPAGSLTLLAGREGLGKSTIAAQICAQVTLGTLDGELRGTPRNVLYVHSEDSREFTVAPRLKAAGADMSRVLFVDVETANTDTGTLILPLDTLALEDVIARENVAFVVLDAATSSMSSDLSGKDDRAVRQYLEPLAQLASRQGCVVFGLCHFGKRDGADTGKLILGSIAWSQVARSVLSVAKDDETGHLFVTNTKGNLAPRVRSMEAAIESTAVHTDDGTTEVGALRWLGETNRDARDLLAGDDDDADERDEITAVIQDYLIECGGSAPASDVLKTTRAAGLNDNAVKKARKKAGVRTERRGFGKGASWVWTIDAPIDSIDSHSRERESMAPMAESMPEHSPAAHTPTMVPQCPACSFPLDGAAAGKSMHPDCERRERESRDLFGGDAA